MTEINLKQVLEQFPMILQDTKKLKGILSDLFPEAPKGLLRVVVTIAEEGIAEQISVKQSLSSMEISRYVTKLENDYGYSSKLTEQALALWTEAFAVTTPNAPTPTKASDVKTAEAVSVSTKAKPKMQTKSAVRNFTPTKKTTQTTQTKKTAPLRKVHDPYRGQNKYDFAIEGGVLKKYKGSASSVIIPDIVTSIGDGAFKDAERKLRTNPPRFDDAESEFELIIQTYPEGENAKLYSKAKDFADACLAKGDFTEAKQYYDLILAGDTLPSRLKAARWGNLLAKLSCRNREEFLHCGAFSKELPEYLALLSECVGDQNALMQYTDLADQNIQTVAEDEQKRREETERRLRVERERREAEERAERERREAAERAEHKRRVTFKLKIAVYVMLSVATVLFLIGIILWINYGWLMPYRGSYIAVFFLLALLLFIAGVILFIEGVTFPNKKAVWSRIIVASSVASSSILACVSFVLFMGSLVSISEKAYDAYGDGFYYNIVKNGKEEEVCIAAPRENNEKVIIPPSIDGMPVTSIASDAFCEQTQLKIVEIPSSVTSIGSGAFEGCSGLTSITIPNSVTSIGERAFYDCSGLTIYCEVSRNPYGWSSYWNYGDCPVVWNCSGNEVASDSYIYAVIEGIRYALKDNVAMVAKQPKTIAGDITIPQTVTYKETIYNVTSIGSFAFEGCSGLTSVTIPSRVTSIGEYVFYGCSGLTSITIPSSVTSIGEYAFYGCSKLTSITIPSSVTSIGEYVFYGCSGLTIYCEASRKPHGWSDRWNPSNCPVVWGYRG